MYKFFQSWSRIGWRIENILYSFYFGSDIRSIRFTYGVDKIGLQ